MIIKALKTIGALFLLMYVIASGFVVDNVLFQIKPQNITDVICCIMGFGFIVDFLLRLCLVKNKLYFISGYATLPISRRKMLWLSVFLNSLSIYNVLGVILLAPTLFHIVASSHQAFVFLLMILTLALFNGAVVRAIKSFETMGKMLSGGIAIVMYALLGYGLLRSESGVIMSVDTVALLGIVLSVLVLALAIEYRSVRKELYKSFEGTGTQHVTFGFFQGRGNMFPILMFLRNKVFYTTFILIMVLFYSIVMSMIKSIALFGINLSYLIIPVFLAITTLMYNPFTTLLSEYIEGLVTMKRTFVKDMMIRYHRILSMVAILNAGIIVLIIKEYLFVFSVLIFVVMVIIPASMYDISFASKRRKFFSSKSIEISFDYEFKSIICRWGIMLAMSLPFVLMIFYDKEIACYILLFMSMIWMLCYSRLLGYIADRFWRNRHKILDGMREG